MRNMVTQTALKTTIINSFYSHKRFSSVCISHHSSSLVFFQRSINSHLSPPSRLIHQTGRLPSQHLESDSLSSFSSDQLRPIDLNDTDNIFKSDPDEISRRSNDSLYGSTRQSIIKLPSELINGVQEVIQSVTHRSTIRTKALGIYGKYRLTSSKESLEMSNDDLMESFLAERDPKDSKKLVKPALRTTYDHLTTISFAAAAMPSNYGSTLRVLLEVKRRLNSDQIRSGLSAEWSPKTLVDYGSGTGSAAWAALEVWPESIEEYIGLDKSSSMIWLNEHLLNRLPSSNQTFASLGPKTSKSKLKMSFRRVTISPTKAEKEKESILVDEHLIDSVETLASPVQDAGIQFRLPSVDDTGDLDIQIQSKLLKSNDTGVPNGLLAIMSFTLSDLPNQAARREAIEGIWNSGAETIVIIDRGTPAGFQIVADARQQLLMLGRREARKSQMENPTVTTSASDDVERNAVDASSQNSSSLGSWVLAPCPHDKPCPLHLSDNPNHFCHFSQRIERPKFLKDTKHTSKHEEDAKYSYVVIRRGRRGSPLKTAEPAHTSSKSGDEVSENSTKAAALEWPRIILPPHKSKGHVIFDVCAASGEIERMTIPRSQGKQDYYDARKTFWGDCWPHGSKKPPIVKELTGRNRNRGDRRRKKKALESQMIA